MNTVKEYHGNSKSTITKLSIWAIQLIIAISLLHFLKLAFFGDMADMKPSVLTFVLTLLALITTFLMLCHYQNLIEEFSRQKGSLEKEVRAEEERRKLEAKMLEP
jgi:uncharacterized membrane protein YqhA